jgi:hypothetical protein
MLLLIKELKHINGFASAVENEHGKQNVKRPHASVGIVCMVGCRRQKWSFGQYGQA